VQFGLRSLETLLELPMTYCVPRGCFTPDAKKAQFYLQIATDYLVSGLQLKLPQKEREPYLRTLKIIVDMYRKGFGVLEKNAELASKYAEHLTVPDAKQSVVVRAAR